MSPGEEQGRLLGEDGPENNPTEDSLTRCWCGVVHRPVEQWSIWDLCPGGRGRFACICYIQRICPYRVAS